MDHDSSRFYAAPIISKLAAASDEQRLATAAASLAPLDTRRCASPGMHRQRATRQGGAAGLASLSSSDTLMSFGGQDDASVAMEVRVDRSKVIGKGQYSTVCFATLEQTGSDKKQSNSAACAVKIPHANNLDARELGLIEAAALAQLGPTPPAVVECFGLVNLGEADERGICPVRSWAEAGAQAIGSKGGEWALVLEYCERGPCWQWMTENKAAMDAELFFLWARQLTLALIALRSAGLAHKDIKGHNMLLDCNGDIRLADFTAAQFSAQALAVSQEACPEFDPMTFPAYTDFSGTIPYSAPEMLASPAGNNAALSADKLHKADIYSLGVSLYTLFVSGREPYATVKSSVEQMLLAAKGAFWEWEERYSLASLSNRSPGDTTPASPLDGPSGRCTQPPSPVSAAATLDHGLSRSLSLTLGPKPLRRRRTLKSRKAAPREFRTFLSGDPLPTNIEALLQSMVSPDPHLRPDATEILRMLDSIEPDIFEP
ncbi:hypothetical protein GGI20_003886 [Coemansia sp. BCRC 34301]|nr:hypothetical protein GGI20_003886 [Coemansia sp. BCRC 34301]